MILPPVNCVQLSGPAQSEDDVGTEGSAAGSGQLVSEGEENKEEERFCRPAGSVSQGFIAEATIDTVLHHGSPIRYNPANGIACFILGMGLEEILGASMAIAIVEHRHVLVALASAAAVADVQSVNSGAGTIIEQQRVPWDSQSPLATQCLKVPYWC
jgi:hypothetical protein